MPQFHNSRGFTFVEVGGVYQYILQMLLATANLYSVGCSTVPISSSLFDTFFIPTSSLHVTYDRLKDLPLQTFICLSCTVSSEHQTTLLIVILHILL